MSRQFTRRLIGNKGHIMRLQTFSAARAHSAIAEQPTTQYETEVKQGQQKTNSEVRRESTRSQGEGSYSADNRRKYTTTDNTGRRIRRLACGDSSAICLGS